MDPGEYTLRLHARDRDRNHKGAHLVHYHHDAAGQHAARFWTSAFAANRVLNQVKGRLCAEMLILIEVSFMFQILGLSGVGVCWDGLRFASHVILSRNQGQSRFTNAGL